MGHNDACINCSLQGFLPNAIMAVAFAIANKLQSAPPFVSDNETLL